MDVYIPRTSPSVVFSFNVRIQYRLAKFHISCDTWHKIIRYSLQTKQRKREREKGPGGHGRSHLHRWPHHPAHEHS